EVDPSQIEQVINALILNAREAMPHGGRIRISACNIEMTDQSDVPLAPGRYVKVSLTDAGHGISPELASRIFDPYFTTKAVGSGLGLSISYSIIKKHGGLLHLETSSSEGSTFVFYLPGTTKASDNAEDRNGGRRFGFSRQRVLVMDDDAAVRDLTAQLLDTLGYEVTAVPDGHEAVKVYEHALRCGQGFEAVILD